MFEQILNSSSSELREARAILHNIVCRRLYKCLGQTQPDQTVTVSQVCAHVSLENSCSFLVILTQVEKLPDCFAPLSVSYEFLPQLEFKKFPKDHSVLQILMKQKNHYLIVVG